MNTSKRFKNVNGVYLLKELFFELAGNRENVLFTMKREDHKGYPSLYRLYIESNDPTEYRFATENLGGWDHWETLSRCSWMALEVQKWRKELEVRHRSFALSLIMSKAEGNTRESFMAARYIADGWNTPKNTKGRPSKAEIRENAQQLFQERKTLEDDFNRIELMN